MSKPTPPLTYADAGVDIEAADALVNDIKTIARRTHRPGVLKSIGGFGALFELPWDQYQQPVLVSGTDGVGTKLKLAMNMNKHDTIGIDLVAMCVNDIITCGAEPLFFLDYFATGKLDPEQAQAILRGIGHGCELANTALIGGETAEMPGLYQGEDYDLAGFTVGIVEKAQILDPGQVQNGDILIGLASSGIHSNGYSLVRRVLELSDHTLTTPFADTTLGETLLTPTRIYVRSVLALLNAMPVHGLAHITGGGLTENLPRVLPEGLCAQIDTDSWQWPAIFTWLQQQGNIDTAEMYRTFNNGIGMVAIVPSTEAQTAIDLLKAHGETAWVLGAIRQLNKGEDNVQYRGGK